MAARFSMKPEIAEKAEELREMGIEITSRWLAETAAPTAQLGDFDDPYLTQTAEVDVEDINEGEGLVFFSVPPTMPVARGGRHVEFGMALALKKAIYVVGPKENIFHYLPQVRVFATWEDFITYIQGKLDEEKQQQRVRKIGSGGKRAA